MARMLDHMKRTTFVLQDGILEAIRREANRRDCDMSEVVNEFLRAGLHRRPPPRPNAPKLPTFAMGQPSVDLADRDALENRMGRP